MRVVTELRKWLRVLFDWKRSDPKTRKMREDWRKETKLPLNRSEVLNGYSTRIRERETFGEEGQTEQKSHQT